MFPFFFYRSIKYSWLFLKHFFSFQVLPSASVSYYIKYELIGGGSPRNSSLIWLYTIYATICYRTLYSFLQELCNIAHENTTADILIEDQPCPPLNKVTVDKE